MHLFVHEEDIRYFGFWSADSRGYSRFCFQCNRSINSWNWKLREALENQLRVIFEENDQKFFRAHQNWSNCCVIDLFGSNPNKAVTHLESGPGDIVHKG